MLYRDYVGTIYPNSLLGLLWSVFRAERCQAGIVYRIFLGSYVVAAKELTLSYHNMGI